MASFNRVTLIGNLGRDPDIRFLANGSPVANFSLATSEAWNDKATGNRTEETTWHAIVAYGRTAEIASEFLRKGAQCLVEGRYVSRRYVAKDGTEKVVFEVKCDRLMLMGGRAIDGGEESAPRAARPVAAARPAPERAGALDDLEDDVPF